VQKEEQGVRVPELLAKEKGFKKHCAGNNCKFRHLQNWLATGLRLTISNMDNSVSQVWPQDGKKITIHINHINA
jgi:hypothetical protein